MHVETCRRHYVETGNPVFAWLAYRECREEGLSIPEWVLEYLDRPARDFWEWTNHGAPAPDLGDLGDAVAHALRVQLGRKGPGNVFANALSPGTAKARSLVAGVYARLRADERQFGHAKITRSDCGRGEGERSRLFYSSTRLGHQPWRAGRRGEGARLAIPRELVLRARSEVKASSLLSQELVTC
jgi:hypothetical protein